jgi:hypothetical protein
MRSLTLGTLAGVALALALAPGALATPAVRTGISVTPGHLNHSALRLARELRLRRAHARSAIVGGALISIEQAPWQVSVMSLFSVEGELFFLRCGGALLDEAEVVSAAHCVFNPDTHARIPPSQIIVLAGASNLSLAEPEDQESTLTQVRVHPGYTYDPEARRALPDDVAVLELEHPVVVGATARPIALAPVGSPAEEGAGVNLTGFGQENIEAAPNGELFSIGMTVGYSRECGGEDDALFACARTPTGSLCSGDSGSGLTGSGGATALLAVTDTVQVIEGEPCRAGALGGFASLTTPEIRDFIEGDESPPQAPRGGGAIISGVLQVGRSLSCEPGAWSNAPTYSFGFLDSSSGATLQRSASSSYVLQAGDVGRSILCEVRAANAGGVGIGRTPGLGPILAAPSIGFAPVYPNSSAPASPSPVPPTPAGTSGVEQSAIALASSSITVQSNGTAAVKLACVGSAACHGKLTLTVKITVKVKGRITSRTVPIGAGTFTIEGDRITTVRIKVGPVGRGLLAGAHGHLAGRLAMMGIATRPVPAQVRAVQILQQRAGGRK